MSRGEYVRTIRKEDQLTESPKRMYGRYKRTYDWEGSPWWVHDALWDMAKTECAKRKVEYELDHCPTDQVGERTQLLRELREHRLHWEKLEKKVMKASEGPREPVTKKARLQKAATDEAIADTEFGRALSNIHNLGEDAVVRKGGSDG